MFVFLRVICVQSAHTAYFRLCSLLLRAIFAIACFASFWLAFGAVGANAQTILLMAEQDGCYWCERWDAEIAPIYEKTAEGQLAPLERYDIHTPLNADIRLKSDVHFTPTFIVLKDGLEMGRIEGYPGEDFFWGLLSELIENITQKAENAE